MDDFLIASSSYHLAEELESRLKARFKFGKYKHTTREGADFVGRRIRVFGDRITVDQATYILEEVRPMKVAKGRLSNPQAALTEEEFISLRSLVYKLNWLGRESRPEAAGGASITASHLKEPIIKDVQCVNKLVTHLRRSASRPIVIWAFPVKELAFATISDAGGVGGNENRLEEDGLPSDCTQGAWMVVATSKAITKGIRAPVSVLAWHSSKLRRRISSTLSGETLALSAAIGEVEWLQLLWRDVVHGDVTAPRDWKWTAPFTSILKSDCRSPGGAKQLHVIDAKSCYDALQKGGSASARDRRTAIELAIIAGDLAHHRATVRWVPHGRMPVDSMTKADISSSNAALTELIQSGHLSLVDVAVEMAARQEGSASKSRTQAASRRTLEAERTCTNEGTEEAQRRGNSVSRPPGL